VAGFLASSMGIRVDVENHTVRLAINFALSLLSSAIYVFVYRILLGMTLDWNWIIELLKAIGNTLIAVVLFPVLDRLQIRE